jgi:hypothetical protein
VATLVWGIEWRLALSRKRDLALRVLAPLSVVFVIASGAVPAVAAVASYAVLFIAFGHYGAALPVLSDADRGIISRVVRGGVSPASYLLQRAAASAALAVLELIPASLVAAAFLNASTSEILIALGAITICLWIASLMGVMAAAVSRSASELGVLCGVGLVLLLHMSGVFHTPSPDGLGALLESASPFRALHEAFVTMVAGGPVRGFATAAVWAVALMVTVGVAAPRLTASLERSS